jgi:hypothetical protein
MPPTKTQGLLDDGEAKRCYQSYVDYSLDRIPRWKECHPSKTPLSSDRLPFSGSNVLLSVQTIGPGSTYKACDDIPRLKFSPNAKLTRTTATIMLTHHGWDVPPSWTEDCAPATTTRSPRCRVPREFCDSLWTSYHKALEMFSETGPFQTAPGMTLYPCQIPDCHLNDQDDHVVIYWPPEVVSRNICAREEADFGRTLPPRSPSVTTITKINFPGLNSYHLSWVSDGYTGRWDDPRLEPSVLTGSWELTSPNILVAHRAMVMTSDVVQNGEYGGVTNLQSARLASLLYRQRISTH